MQVGQYRGQRHGSPETGLLEIIRKEKLVLCPRGRSDKAGGVMITAVIYRG